MAVLMQMELEGIASHTAELTRDINHLAWVQEQAAHAQLSAQFRLAQLQVQTIEEIGKANDTLVQVSSQLIEVADILRQLKGTQDEHLRIVKAERTLKEVLFQLTTMLEDMIIPSDDIARLLLCQVALDEFDQHGLGTAHLNDLADKRAFADFVKSTRKTVRDVPAEVQADLTAFETGYKNYQDQRGYVFPPFEPIDCAAWIPNQGPEWLPGRAPQWLATPEPKLVLRPLPPKPETRTHPGDHPLPQQFGEMPTTIFVGGDLINYPYQRVLPGSFTPDTVPSRAETMERLPTSRRGVMQFLDSVFCSAEWNNARQFEEALRSWASQCQAYDTFVRELAAWEQTCEAVTAENKFLTSEVHPRQLQEWREKEVTRRADYEQACKKHAEEEERRHAEWEAASREHEEKEAARHSAWEVAKHEHETKEAERYEEWQQGLQAFLQDFRALGNHINEFLEEHPDIQLVYSKVRVDEDTKALEERVPGGAGKGFARKPKRASPGPMKTKMRRGPKKQKKR